MSAAGQSILCEAKMWLEDGGTHLSFLPFNIYIKTNNNIIFQVIHIYLKRNLPGCWFIMDIKFVIILVIRRIFKRILWQQDPLFCLEFRECLQEFMIRLDKELMDLDVNIFKSGFL